MFFSNSFFKWQTSKVTTMRHMFESAHAYDGSGISGWGVDQVTDMFRMFAWTQNFNADLSGWNTIRVTNMAAMFRDSIYNNDVSSFNVAQVTTMYYMFYETPFDSNISHWDTGRVTNFDGMLRKTPFDQDISKVRPPFFYACLCEF
jgi:surface protein